MTAISKSTNPEYLTVICVSRETEARAQRAEEGEAQKATDLIQTQQKVRELERQLEELQAKAEAGQPLPTASLKSVAEEPRWV